MQAELQPLLTAIQRNCDISDARHAGDYTLCIYLLKMREYFRWEQGLKFDDHLLEGDVGAWLKAREELWASIEDEPFDDLPLGGNCYDPFDDQAMNAALNPQGLVYSGGLGNFRAPHFFLGKLHREEKQADSTILISDTEYARDLTAPPAMTRGDTIFIRRESLRRMAWEKIEEWRWNKLENAMGRALRCFDFERDSEAALEQMTDSLLHSVLLHEQGEALAGKRLGPEWEQLLAVLPRSKTEFLVRAVRDHLADSLTTLPGLLARREDAPLHFFFANLTNLRKHLFPALTQAYEAWVAQRRHEIFDDLLATSQPHWNQLAQQVLDIFRRDPHDCAAAIQHLIENNRL